jgi:hypothetical protein
MARLINHNKLFIHTAKTGGTFFREAINHFGIPNEELCEKHSGINDLPFIASLPLVNRVFGFVRNPLTWYRSRWAYAVMTNFHHKLAAFPISHPIHDHWMAPVWSNDLNKFVLNTLTLYPDGIAWEYFNKMLDVENYKTNGIEIYRYESLVYVTSSILTETLGREIPIRSVNRLRPQLSSSSIGGTISPELIKEIEKTEHRLLNMYY